ncbi:MAG: class I SAM-dependent methyltransferase [Bdellovibrio sp.]|nr:class I SAM-dependent methyltransferase [Bdellovibrio sp.]
MSAKQNFEELTKELPNVGKTLFVPLLGRARAKHFDIPFEDIKAEKLAQNYELGHHIYLSSLFSKACIVRARAFDEWVRSSLGHDGILISLGAGLCTRHQRLSRETHNAQTFEVDFPEVIGLKRKLYGEGPGQLFLASNILDDTWALEVKKNLLAQKGINQPFFITLEGVGMYLTPEQITTLMKLLKSHFPGAQFAFDYISPWLVSRAYLLPAISQTNSQFHFAPDNIREFAKQHQLILKTDKSIVTELLDQSTLGKFFRKGPWSSLYKMAWFQLP